MLFTGYQVTLCDTQLRVRSENENDNSVIELPFQNSVKKRALRAHHSGEIETAEDEGREH